MTRKVLNCKAFRPLAPLIRNQTGQAPGADPPPPFATPTPENPDGRSTMG